MARGFLLILLLLAVSPVTAPFSSRDLGDLLSGAPSGGAGVQAKSSDKWAPGLGPGADLDLRGWVFPPSAGAVRQEHRGEPLRVPLRI
jgi:hypothetical protein